MKAAVLCNGPSRTTYFARERSYDLTIGCNIPWTNVDVTVIMDKDVVRAWAKDLSLITVPVIFSTQAWMETAVHGRQKFLDQFVCISDTYAAYTTTGHLAAKLAIQRGATKVDIYGCDSMFVDDISSYTHQYAKSGAPASGMENLHITKWRQLWEQLRLDNPTVKLDFIYEDFYQTQLS